MFVQVIMVVLVAARLGYRLNVNLQPLLRPFPQSYTHDLASLLGKIKSPMRGA